MRAYIHADPEKCTGCRICENFCSFKHESAIWPAKARIRVMSEFDEGPFDPVVCIQCDDAPCAEACPIEIITFNEATGAWVLDQEECTGCEACIDACPYGAIFFDPVSFISLKCDLCGGKPECVPACPTGALSHITEE